MFGIDLSVTATSSQTRLRLIAPDGAAMDVGTGVTHLNFHNYNNIQGTWTLQVGTYDNTPSYSVTAWSMTVLGQANAPAPPGITVTPNSGLVSSEAGGTANFSVVLNSPPAANVTIGVSSSDTTEGIVSASSLTFTPQNWNTPQTVTVTGVDDTVRDGDIAYSIVLAPAVSGDASYNGLDASDVAVTNKDNEKGKINTSSSLNFTTSSLIGASAEPAPLSDSGASTADRPSGGSKSAANPSGAEKTLKGSATKKNIDAVFADWDDPLGENALDALLGA